VHNGGRYSYNIRNIKTESTRDFDELPWQTINQKISPSESYLIEINLQKDPPFENRKKNVIASFSMEVENTQTGLTYVHKGYIRTHIT